MTLQKVIVTGASGYIGSSMLKSLVECGLYHPVALLRKKVSYLPAGVETRTGNLSDAIFLRESLADADVIIHNAGRKGTDACVNDIVGTIEANIRFTERLLAAVTNSRTRIVFSSTYWVYGHLLRPPFNEEQAVSPSELYGWTKAVAEKLIVESGLDYIILRLSNIFGYGSGIKFNEAASFFISRAKQGAALMLHNSGKQCVDLLSVDDLCAVLLDLLKMGAQKTILNIGSGVPVSVAALAELVNEVTERLFNSKAVLFLGEPEENEIQFADRWVDITKLKKMTDFIPSPLVGELEKFAYKL